MKKLLPLALVLLALVIPILGYSQSSIFTQIKNEALKSSPDKDGDYLAYFNDDEYSYVVGYVAQSKIGCSAYHKESRIQVVVVYDEGIHAYIGHVRRDGIVLKEGTITEESAVRFATDLLKKIRTLCKLGDV